ncbi:MAG TPA: hypothetical protein VMT32_21000 [Bryobacteraceae bacterium]|nr:hypothetical protein [Bryobacteraceae bacterium]
MLSRTGPAEILEQEDHFVFLILQGTGAMGIGRHGAPAGMLELLDRLRQLGAAAPASPTAFENTGAQKLGDVLHLVDS